MSQTRKKIRFSWPVIVLAVFYLYLGFHALSGNQGLLSWAHYSDEISTLKLEISTMSAKQKVLELRADQLRARHLDLDRLDEVARQNLNVSHINEVVIWLDESQ